MALSTSYQSDVASKIRGLQLASGGTLNTSHVALELAEISDLGNESVPCLANQHRCDD